MKQKLMQLAARREHLVAQAAAQRRALAQNIEPWRIPLALADRGLDALRAIKRQPTWIAAAAAVLVALRPGRLGNWLRRGWIAWQIVQQLRGR